MNSLPQPLLEAIENLSNLPGIGSRSAERLIFSLLKNNSNLDQKISASIGKLKRSIKECETCFHLCEGSQCSICQNTSRDQKTLCVIESPLDLIALERTHEYKGLYHVLHGVISPLNKTSPEDLKINKLIDRIKKSDSEIQEIILATSGSIEGDATAMYIVREIRSFFKGKITRLARGIPSGGDLDYLDIGTISRAIMERRDF